MKPIFYSSFTPEHHLRFVFFCFTLWLFDNSKLLAQCSPPMAESCEEAQIICSIDELNGYTCNNPSTIPSPCSPLCSQGGVGHNTSWLAFVSDGGTRDFTITIGGCSSNQGVQFGIWGDCNCGEEVICRSIPCIPPNSVINFAVSLQACKVYYLFMDGCSGDICDFTINTSGGGRPELNDILPINDDPDGIIDSICEGACNVRFFVRPQGNACSPSYFWTLDGNELAHTKSEIDLDFPNSGDFKLCVTAVIGNPGIQSPCSQSNQQCAILKVRPAENRYGQQQIICWEDANPGGKKWHSQRITTSGHYRQQFTDNTCCKYDSIVEFIVLDPPKAAEVLHVSCNNTPYIDALGRSTFGCKDRYEISLPKFTQNLHCDSTILLTSAFFSIKPNFDVKCQAGDYRIKIHPDFGTLCSFLDSVDVTFRWYLKDDPDKNLLSDADTVKAFVSSDYCVDFDFRLISNNRFDTNCLATFCYEIKTDSLFVSNPAFGPLSLCSNDIGVFKFDSSLISGSRYQWTADGDAVIHSIDTGSKPSIRVSWFGAGIKNLCISTIDPLNSNCLYCQQVEIVKAARSGRDSKVLGLHTRMKAEKADFGVWSQISGPGKASFENVRDPNTRVKVTKSGRYVFEWAALQKNCVDKDSVEIDFFTKPLEPMHLIFFINDEENESQELEERDQNISIFRFYTPSLIPSYGTSYIKTSENLVFENAEYSWKNASGQNIITGRIDNYHCNPSCAIKAPSIPGLYFLLLTIEGKQLLKKVIVIN